MTQNQDSNVNHLCAVLYGDTLSVAWHKGAQNTSCDQTSGFFFVLDPYTPVLRCYHMSDYVLNNKTNAGRKPSGSSALQSFLLLCSRFFEILKQLRSSECVDSWVLCLYALWIKSRCSAAALPCCFLLSAGLAGHRKRSRVTNRYFYCDLIAADLKPKEKKMSSTQLFIYLFILNSDTQCVCPRPHT